MKEDHPGGLKELAAPLHGFRSINTEQGQHPTTRSFRAPQHVFQSRNHPVALISPGLPLPRASHSPSWVPCLYLDCLFSQFIPARPDIRAACLSLVGKRETSARGSSIREEAPQSCLGFRKTHVDPRLRAQELNPRPFTSFYRTDIGHRTTWALPFLLHFILAHLRLLNETLHKTHTPRAKNIWP